MANKIIRELGKKYTLTEMADALTAPPQYTNQALYQTCLKLKDENRMLRRENEKIAFLEARVASLESQLTEALGVIRDLQNRLNKDSSNSGKPPSTDGFRKKRRNLREKTGKPRGGQIGHPGKTLLMRENPDRIIVHEVTSCECCGNSLAGIPASSTERRQVYDIPPLSIEVTEHRGEIKKCPFCKAKNKAEFPDNVPASVQYGENVKAFVSFAMAYQFIPYQRTCEFFETLFSHPISLGTINNIVTDFYESSEVFEEALKERLRQAPVIHCDESGMSVEKKRHYVFVCSNDKLTHYYYGKGRGRKQMDEMGILPGYTGVAVHDGWKSYFGYGCAHALCNVHHLRELKGLIEDNFDGIKWLDLMFNFLKEKKKFADSQKMTNAFIPYEIIDKIVKEYDKIVEDGLNEYNLGPPAFSSKKKRGKKKQPASKNLLDRLKKSKTAVLAFLLDFRVPFDNNQAERDIRMIKVRQKISGAFRSESGPKIFCRMRSYISTVKKQGLKVFESIKNVFLRKPFIPKIAQG